MSMLLLDSYSFGNRKADVFQLQENLFRTELYEDNKLITAVSCLNVTEASTVAQSFTNGNKSQLLNENA